MVTKDYARIAKEVGISQRRLAERVGVKHPVVNRVLLGKKEGIASKATKKKIYDELDAELQRKLQNLLRLSNGECIPD